MWEFASLASQSSMVGKGGKLEGFSWEMWVFGRKFWQLETKVTIFVHENLEGIVENLTLPWKNAVLQHGSHQNILLSSSRIVIVNCTLIFMKVKYIIAI